jgi:subtilisin family serine protease
MFKPKPKPEPVTPVPPPTGALPGTNSDTLDYSRKIMNIENAWKISQGRESIVVAVIDSGADLSHPDLKNNLWVNPGERGGAVNKDNDQNGYANDLNGWDFVSNRSNPWDDNNHGTHCAGIIAAEINQLGIAGVAPRIKIMVLKTADATGTSFTSDSIKAIDYAVANGANIISMSWGSSGRSELLNESLQRAVKKGVLLVAAAGNAASDVSTQPFYPAGFANVISVGSTNEVDGMSSFSNYSPTAVMIAAPGSNILSTITGGRWSKMSGTSMATPQVAGALALALSVAPNQDRGDLKAKLCSSAKPILKDKFQCGRMDVEGLLKAL